MKIHSVIVKKLSFPIKPLTTNLRTYDHLTAIACYIYENTDLYGTSFLYGLGNTSLEAISQEIYKLGDEISKTASIESLLTWKKFSTAHLTQESPAKIFALAAVDIAMWDLFAKKAQKPLSKLLNPNPSNQIAAYGTTGWLSLSAEALIEECKKYASQGINGFKIRLGAPDDLERITAVRNAMGNDYRLMLDANQRYTYEEAKTIIKKMAPLNITWLEEPLSAENNQYLLTLKKDSPILIAVGENIFNLEEFEKTCQEKSADIIQPDVIRCGGLTGFIQAAEITKKYQLPLCNHLLAQLSVSVLAAFPNSYLLEYEDILPAGIYTNDFSIIGGMMQVPSVPGSGVELTKDAIKEFEIA